MDTDVPRGGFTMCSYHSLLGFRPDLGFLLYSSLLALTACGGITGQPGIGADGSGGGKGASYSLAGEWQGLYKAKQTETSGVRETNAKVTVEPTGDLIGNFKLELPSYQGANVSGTYRDFAGKSMIIDIASSNFSALGLTGSKTDLPYDLVGDALEFSNDRFALKLTRQGNQQTKDVPLTQTSGTGSQGASRDLLGRWTCQDGSRFVWKLNIKTSNTFAIDVLDSAGAQASMWMDGVATITPAANLYTANLRVEASDVPKYVGKTYVINQTDKDAATLVHNEERGGALTCSRNPLG